MGAPVSYTHLDVYKRQGEVHVIERSTQIQPGAAAKYGRFAFALQPLDLTTCVNLELRGGIRLKYVH